MRYIFSGQFQGMLAPNYAEPLANLLVRLYRYHGTQYITSLAVADPEKSMKELAADEIAGKSSALLAETRTDAAGNFEFVLDEALEYKGDALDVDLYIDAVPGAPSSPPAHARQIALTTMKPRWEESDEKSDEKSDGALHASWRYTFSQERWSALRGRFDAWLVCGRVVDGATGEPVPQAHVRAFDVDWIQDDDLGSAIADQAGYFRIDYTAADFRKTLLSPLINMEQGGPDLYFTVASHDGALLLEEYRSRGNDPDRKDAPHCFYVELPVHLLPTSPASMGGAAVTLQASPRA